MPTNASIGVPPPGSGWISCLGSTWATGTRCSPVVGVPTVATHALGKHIKAYGIVSTHTAVPLMSQAHL